MIIDILIGLLVGLILSQTYLHISIVVCSVVFSLLPDLDFLIWHTFNPIDRFSHKHRRILHLPIIYIVLGLVVIRLVNVDSIFYVSFIILSLFHFIHDTFSLGFGVQWLFPFSRRQYFLNDSVPTSKSIFRKFHSDMPKNIDAHADMHGDNNWAKKSFFK